MLFAVFLTIELWEEVFFGGSSTLRCFGENARVGDSSLDLSERVLVSMGLGGLCFKLLHRESMLLRRFIHGSHEILSCYARGRRGCQNTGALMCLWHSIDADYKEMKRVPLADSIVSPKPQTQNLPKHLEERLHLLDQSLLAFKA